MDYKEKVEWLGRYQASVSCQHMLEEEIEVLRRRYVMGQNFSEIAEAMGVVQRRAYQLHRTAVEGMAVPKRA